MGTVRVLPELLINKIAAGEVVERPSSVVKELVENSLDAGATDIRVNIEDGGKRLIQVQDNGCGMNPDDALLALERHATSKIRDLDDLEKILTLGFRGEALPSIASVSKVHLVTADGKSPTGSEIEIEGGTIKIVRDAGRSKGTTIEIRNLFNNTPVRKKFLKTSQTELSHITGAMTEMALAHPHVYFTLRHKGRSLIKVPAVSSLLDRAQQLFGKEKRENLMEVEEGREGLHLFGLVSVPGYTAPTGTHLNFFVNRRPVNDRTLRHAVYQAYETLLMKGRHPMVYLFLDIDPSLVDVNVHPTKREVRFTEGRLIHGFLRDSVRKALQSFGRSFNPSVDEGEEQEGTLFDVPNTKEQRVREAVEGYFRTQDLERIRSKPYQPPNATARRESVRMETKPAAEALFQEESLVPIGQIANSFIVTQDKDGLILVDQHAAHERILYEKFKSYYKLSKIPIQHLLIPVNLELSQKEEILLKEHMELLNQLGIEIEDFGQGTYTVKGVPMWVADSNIEEVVHSILEEIQELEQSGELQRKLEEVIHVFSCRSAVKANQPMSREEMNSLLKDLSRTDSPYTCEHGRPTMIRIGFHEIEKMFKRR